MPKKKRKPPVPFWNAGCERVTQLFPFPRRHVGLKDATADSWFRSPSCFGACCPAIPDQPAVPAQFQPQATDREAVFLNKVVRGALDKPFADIASERKEAEKKQKTKSDNKRQRLSTTKKWAGKEFVVKPPRRTKLRHPHPSQTRDGEGTASRLPRRSLDLQQVRRRGEALLRGTQGSSCSGSGGFCESRNRPRCNTEHPRRT
jgi:hypothetical protein